MKKLLVIAFAMIAMPMISSAQIAPAPTVPPVYISVVASPTAVVPGDKSTVSWVARNALSCKFDSGITRFGFPSGDVPTTGSQVVAPTTVTGPVYGTIACKNLNGVVTATASIRVALLPAISVVASPSAVVPGATSTVSWVAKNKASCTFDSDIYNLTRFGFPTGAVPATGSVVVTLTSATGPVYGTITCRDIYGLSPVRAYVRVGLLPPPAPAVEISVTASPTAVVPGATSTVSWVAKNASSCTFDHELQDITRFGFATGTVPVIGSQVVLLTKETGAVYGTITCRNIYGLKPVQAPVRVGLLPPPVPAVTVSVVASRAYVVPGDSSVITWSSTNATSCTFDHELQDLTRFGFPAGGVATSGSHTVTPTFTTGPVIGTLTCYNNGGIARASVNVGLLSPLVLDPYIVL